MKLTVLRACFSIMLIYTILISGCVDNTGYPPIDGMSGSNPSKSKSRPSRRGKVSLIGQIKAGPLNIGVNIDEKGKVAFTTGLSPVISIPLGFMSLEFGIKNTIPLTEEKPHQLFIIVKDANGELQRTQYDIGEEFQFVARKIDEVQVIQKNDCTIITIINAQSYSLSEEQINVNNEQDEDKTGMDKFGENFIVDTRDDSGVYLRSEKSIQSSYVTYTPEGESVIFLGCDPEKVRVNSVDKRYGRWCRAKYNDVEGWVWGWYIHEQSD